MIISTSNPRIDKLQTDVSAYFYIGLNKESFPLILCATPYELAPYRGTAGVINVPKLYPLAINPSNLMKYNDNLPYDDNRPVSPRITSIKIVEEWYPASIKISEKFQNQSKMSFSILATKLLVRLRDEIEELKIRERIISQAKHFNGTTKADIAKDLEEITSEMMENQAAEVYMQSIATTQINTSGVVKAFACVSGVRGSLALANAYIALKDGGFISNFQYAGVQNYSNYNRGVYNPHRLSITWSDHPSYTDDIALIFGSDSFGRGNPNISNDGIYQTNPMTESPIGAHYTISMRNVISIGIFRQEHLFTYGIPTT